MDVKFYPPHSDLKEYILMYSFVSITSEELLQTKFLPDNNSSLSLFLNDNFKLVEIFSGEVVHHRINYSGKYSTPSVFSVDETLKVINIDFVPWGAHAIFGIDQDRFHNKSIDATEIFPSLKKYVNDIEEHLDDVEYCIQTLEQFLLNELYSREKKVDERIIMACQKISESHGQIAIKDLCKEIGMSHTGFTTHFAKIIGINPKLFTRVARFNALHSFLTENPTAGWMEIVHKFDYFDQNHFIREFKQFTGSIPKNRKQWEALFDPVKAAMEEGYHNNEEQMKLYREKSLYHIIYNISV